MSNINFMRDINPTVIHYLMALEFYKDKKWYVRAQKTSLKMALMKHNLSIDEFLDTIPLEHEDYKILFKNEVKDEIISELSYPCERLCYLFGEYKKDDYGNELRIYDLINHDELNELFDDDVVISKPGSCDLNIDSEVLNEELEKIAYEKGFNLVGELHTHKIEKGHTKGPNPLDIGCCQLGLAGFVAYFSDELHIVPFRKKDFASTDKQLIEDYYSGKEDFVEFF